MKRKYYLIDTENVGDRWYKLIEKLQKKDRVISFYTQNHSKRMEKCLFKQVRNNKILWIECTAGSNALDYQLIGVLSYLIAKHPKSSFCIYSNDKDYKSTVDFWQSQGVDISQKEFEVTKNKKSKQKKTEQNKVEKQEIQDKVIIDGIASIKERLCHGKLKETQCIEEIAKSIPTSELVTWYHVYTAIFGQKNGRNLYLEFKSNAQMREKLSKYYNENKYLRGVNFVAVILNQSGLDVKKAEEAYKIIKSHSHKDLNNIKNKFDEKFGKKPPQIYYSKLKPFIKIISTI